MFTATGVITIMLVEDQYTGVVPRRVEILNLLKRRIRGMTTISPIDVLS
jgi:hypothetical protein